MTRKKKPTKRADKKIRKKSSKSRIAALLKPPRIKMQDIGSMKLEKLEWLIWPYLPRGELTLLLGDPGLGKSYLSIMLAISVADGGTFINGQNIKQGNVFIFTLEDHLQKVVKKRVIDNDCKHPERIFGFPKGFSLNEEYLQQLRKELEKHRPTLVIFDPLIGYFGNARTNNAEEVRAALEIFCGLAAEFNFALVGVGHLNKDSTKKALFRGLGSIAFTAAARVIWMVAERPGHPNERIAGVEKMNYDIKPDSFTFHIESGAIRGDSKFVWGEMSQLTPRDFLNTSTLKDNRHEQNHAIEFLRKTLKDGPKRAKKIQEEAETHSITATTLHNASETLGVIKRKKGGGKGSKWWWRLPT